MFLIAIGLAPPVRADAIDVRAKQLTRDVDYKLRLSAALWLAKKRDPRSVAALTRALDKDPEHAVRQVAAEYLGRLVDVTTPTKVRDRALKVLSRAAKRDRNANVRKVAARSLDRLLYLNSPGPKVFVYVGKPKVQDRDPSSTLSGDLENALTRMVQKQAPEFLMSWPSGTLPTRAELRQTKTRAYIVAAKVGQLVVRKKGGNAQVDCAVSIRINPWDGSDGKERLTAHQTASATGRGQVIRRNTNEGIESAKLDCVLAVGEQIAAKQVVPFIRRLIASR
ncbi:MAG: HEAT repeat domain-containing protein [Proteobacteria bacterium]|nr:HEAT repeat domain-containing protein [Pseudomonadota bacterium]